ncbi:iron ABC transporter permease [Billgrantia azerbaijanica]|nr:iron ABC transporter permease [Halomonas azerbaijanica]
MLSAGWRGGGYLVLLPVTLGVCLLNGSVDTLGLLLAPEQRDLAWQLIGELRLPRVMAAALAGAALGLAGLLLQTLARNPLADPSIIGINQGAALAVVGLLLALPAASPQWFPLAGLAGGVAGGLLLWRLSRGTSGLALILMGIGLNSLLSALTGCLLILADARQLAMVMTWLAGSFAGLEAEQAWATLAWAALLLPLGWLLCQRLTPFLLDALSGRMLEPCMARWESAGLLLACGLGAVAVATAGTLGFVGLLAPHLARLLHPPRPGRLALPTMAYGATLTLLADWLGRSLFAPVQLPAGLMLALLGVPVFVALLCWQQRLKGR